LRTWVRHGVPAYLRDKARKLRTENKLSIVEIADRLALPKTTIWYWVRDLPLGGPHRANASARETGRCSRSTGACGTRRIAGEGRIPELASDPTFRDLVCMYIGEGYKRK
jgi:hypothetical protein